MLGEFHPEVRASQVRGLIELVEKSRGAASMSSLAAKAKIRMDGLLAIVDVCASLKLLSVNNGVVKITPIGKAQARSFDLIRLSGRLRQLEPFRTVIKKLQEYGPMDTHQLVSVMLPSNMAMMNEKEVERKLRVLLLSWAVEARLMDYDQRRDQWDLI